MKTTRTRFAPSPTGALHAGTVRTALFAWLVARHDNGQFILRIEDTDQGRSVDGAIKNIMDSLRYVGIDWDEGPDQTGPNGPYLQSLRLSIYNDWAKQLIDKGRAYADPYSQKELNELRSLAKANAKPFLFRDHRPKNPPIWDGSQPLRFKSEPKAYNWTDAVMGAMSSSAEAVDDFVMIKPDGFPTYNFAHIIDDFLMGITHVIRSVEFVSSVPRYLNLYEALGIEMPILATVPQVLNESGNKKLSKREQAKQLLEYKQMGILSATMINFLATLGWNDGTTQELFTVQELVQKFDLGRVQKSGAKFDEDRLLWMNGHYIRELSIEDLAKKVMSYWPSEAKTYDDEYKKKVLKLIQERLKYLEEVPDLSNFFFTDLPVNLELIKTTKNLKSLSSDQVIELLSKTKISFSESDFTLDDLTTRLNSLLKTTNQKPATLFSLIRIATTNVPASPALAGTLEVLGKATTLKRIDEFIAKL